MKPFESAILFVFSQGYRTPKEIQRILPYKTLRPIEKVLSKYKSHLPSLVSHKTNYIGNNTIYSPVSNYDRFKTTL